jgi:1,4-alpha-glucan branching enzyme
VAACRTAFLEGYAGVAHLDPVHTGPVLRALELDKALYEVIYEVRNRPSWLGIPMAAIDRLVAESSATTSDTAVHQGVVARKGPS